MKHGFGGVLPLMAAWMPVENKEHLEIFLGSIKLMGLDIENIPFMTDRGHLLAAVRFIYETRACSFEKFAFWHWYETSGHPVTIGCSQCNALFNN